MSGHRAHEAILPSPRLSLEALILAPDVACRTVAAHTHAGNKGQMLPLQGSRNAASLHGDKAAVRPSRHETQNTTERMAREDGDAAVEGSSAAVGLGPVFLAKLQQKGLLLSMLF